MRAIADTHTAIWYLWEPERLSANAVAALDESVRGGEKVGLSSITLCEVLYLAEKGRIRPDAFDALMEAIHSLDAVFEEIPLDSGVASFMKAVPRSAIREMPDRIIAATALFRGVPLITKDRNILNSSVPTIW